MCQFVDFGGGIVLQYGFYVEIVCFGQEEQLVKVNGF